MLETEGLAFSRKLRVSKRKYLFPDTLNYELNELAIAVIDLKIAVINALPVFIKRIIWH